MGQLFAASLTVEQVQAEVAALTANHGDDEVAHGDEDNLYAVLIEAIAINRLSGADAQRACVAALQTQQLPFARWCA